MKVVRKGEIGIVTDIVPGEQFLDMQSHLVTIIFCNDGSRSGIRIFDKNMGDALRIVS